MTRKGGSKLAICTLFLSIFAAVGQTQSVSAANLIKNGSTCKEANQSISQGGYVFLCLKKSNKLIWSSTPNFDLPYFQQSDVQYLTPLYAAQEYIQIRITWNGDDVAGQHFPRGTSAAVILDGNLLGDQVTSVQSVSIVVTNQSHAVQLIVTDVGKSQLLSKAVEVDQEPLSPLPAAAALTAEVTLHLQCTGSGETSGTHPGWSSSSAMQLTPVDLGNSNVALYWCPAAAPLGQDSISYTVTASPSGVSCETTTTSCLMTGASSSGQFVIMATDQTGSDITTQYAIQNSGAVYHCQAMQHWCNPGSPTAAFPTYGNVAPVLIGDCTFAAVANWENIVLGINPDPTLIGLEFSQAGGTLNVGLTNDQVFSYWQHYGISGEYLTSAKSVPTDPNQSPPVFWSTITE
ncbi:MAG: hypothetical protein WDN07_02300 [Actinomycetota bacterium]